MAVIISLRFSQGISQSIGVNASKMLGGACPIEEDSKKEEGLLCPPDFVT